MKILELKLKSTAAKTKNSSKGLKRTALFIIDKDWKHFTRHTLVNV